MSKLKAYFWVGLFLVVTGIFMSGIVKRFLTDRWLKTDAVIIRAVVIDEKNYKPNGHIKHDWSYSYLFVISGKSYSNNAHDPNLRVGDTVEVEYVKDWPGLNRPLHVND